MVPLPCDAEGKKKCFTLLIYVYNTPFPKRTRAQSYVIRGALSMPSETLLTLANFLPSYFLLLGIQMAALSIYGCCTDGAYRAALTLFTTAQCLATSPSGQIDRKCSNIHVVSV